MASHSDANAKSCLATFPRQAIPQKNPRTFINLLVLLLSAGMQTQAEIRLGDRTALEYLLSPVSKAWHEAGRER
jgi:hypothetical protein